MAKAPKQKRLIPDAHEVPQDLQDAGDEYATILRSRNKLNGKLNTQEQKTLELMHKHSIPRFVIGDGLKVLTIRKSEKLRFEKRKDEAGGETQGKRRRGRPPKDGGNGAAPAGGKTILEKAGEGAK